MKKITNNNKKPLLIKIVKKYLFQNKEYPALLYNLYGSEGHGKDRDTVDNMIKNKGFWRTVFHLYKIK